MSFRRISLLTLLFLSLSATSAFADAQTQVSPSETPKLTAQSFRNEPGSRQQRRERRGDMMEALDLSQAQQDELQSIRNQYQPRLMEKQQALSEAHQTLREMMIDDNASTSEIRTQHEQVQDLLQEMSNLRFESMLEMREVLTPEQREEFAQLMEERRAGRGRGRGFRGGRFRD